MRLTFVVMLVLFCFSMVFAQSSIGFKAPQNTTPLLEYQLPTWGYNAFNIQCSILGDFTQTKSEENELHPKSTIKEFESSNTFNLEYKFFRESEKSYILLKPQLGVAFQYSEFSEHNQRMNRDRTRVQYSPRVLLDLDYVYYFLPKHRFMFHSQINSRYSKANVKETQFVDNYDNDYEKALLDYHVMSGYSFGRIRNVTPVIRALRFRERLQQRAIMPDLTDEQVQKLARHLAKYSGYQTIHQRYQKYFWQDMQNILDMPTMGMGDAFYLAEIFNELLTERYEGWSIDVGINSTRDYTKDLTLKNDLVYYGPFLQLSWYHNQSLYRNLYLHASTTYNLRSIGDSYNNYKTRWYYTALARHTWTLVDRINWQTETRISNQLTENDYIQTLSLSTFSAYLENQLRILIEDRLYLNLNVDYDYYFDSQEVNPAITHKTKHHNFSYYLTLNYILDNSLQ